MYPHPRPSPRTASAANNPQTNPSRTNNQRDPYSGRSSPYSDTLSYGDRASDEGDAEMVSRSERPPDTDQTQAYKVNHVIGVR